MPGPSSSKPPQLVLRFALYAAIALVVAIAVGVWLARLNATARAERRVWEDATFIAERLGRDDVARSAFAVPASADLVPVLDEVLDRELLGRDILRVSLIDPEGRITYSSDHSLIGEYSEPAQIRRALAGDAVYGVTELGGGLKALESVVPVRWVFAEEAAPSGVLAVYRDYAPVAEEIKDDFLRHAGAIMLALLLLYGAMLPILRRVMNTLEARNRRLKELAAIVEHSDDAIVGTDHQGVIRNWNAAAERVLGYEAEEVIGRNIALLARPEEPLELFERLRRGEVIEHYETACLRKDGTPIELSLTVSPIWDGDRIIAVSTIARDVTERNRLERELREAHKDEALARLASGIADEFDRVLSAVRRQREALRRRRGADQKLERETEQLSDALERGESLTRQLRLYAPREPHETRVLDMNELLQRLEPTLAAITGEAIELKTECAPTREPVEANPEQLEQVILDLARYARDTMPRGGALTLQTADVELRDRPDDTSVRLAPGRYVRLSMSDTGIGGERRGRARPFDPYVDGDDAFGLGLAAVYTVVHRCGGSIGIETDPNRGTTVRIYLPRAADETVAADVAAAAR